MDKLENIKSIQTFDTQGKGLAALEGQKILDKYKVIERLGPSTFAIQEI